MRKLTMTPFLWLLLTISLLANAALIYRMESTEPGKVLVDEKLAGTWKRRNPHGVRLILLWSGEFIVSDYGTPLGPVGRWEATNGRLKIWWAIDEEGGTAVLDTAYKVSKDGTALELSNDIFNTSAKTFIKSKGEI